MGTLCYRRMFWWLWGWGEELLLFLCSFPETVVHGLSDSL